MSVEAIAIALHHSRAKGTAKLVLIGIANHDGDGGAWPSLETLGRYAGCTRDNVRRHVQRLERLGEIRRAVQKGGMADWENHLRPNLYHFLLTCPSTCDGTRNHRERTTQPLPTFAPEFSTPPANLLGDPQQNEPPNPPTNPSIETKKVSHVSNAGARANLAARLGTGNCGHAVVGADDGRRFCAYGCPTAEVGA